MLFFHLQKISFSSNYRMRNGLFKTYFKSDASAVEARQSEGYKATPQRIAICRISVKQSPPSVPAYDEVKKIHPTVSLEAVYKTWKCPDLVQEINFPKRQARFDSYMSPHINLICLKCGNSQT